MAPLHGPRVLLVEEDAGLATAFAQHMQSNQLVVVVEPRGDRVGARIAGEEPNLVTIDTDMTGADDRHLCRIVRAAFAGPILLLTPLADGDPERAAGLEAAADDCLPRSARPGVLLSRVRVLLRVASRMRAATATTPQGHPSRAGCRIEVGCLVVDAGNRTVAVDGRSVPLTTAEFDLLCFLAQNPGEVLSRDRPYREVRSIEFDGVDRSIDLRIARLRRKLGDGAAAPRLIKSVHGVGYLLATGTWGAPPRRKESPHAHPHDVA